MSKRIEDLNGLEFSDAIDTFMKQEVKKMNKQTQAKVKKPKRLNNIEVVVQLMKNGSPLRQLFVLDAITKLANLVAASKPEDYETKDGVMGVHGPSWIQLGKDIKRELDAHYGGTNE